jgi:transcriptional regulator with XRE-family HTH domain
MSTIGQRIKIRRLALSLTQKDAAERSGVAYRTWRRMEGEGKASIEDMVRAAIVLRCEESLATLFPEPVASNMDELLERQRAAAATRRKRVGRARA